MYARKTWGGPVDPFILLKFDKYEGEADATVSLVIFEWKDEKFIGVYPSEDAVQVGRISPHAEPATGKKLINHTESWYLPTQMGRGRLLRGERYWRVYPDAERYRKVQQRHPYAGGQLEG